MISGVAFKPIIDLKSGYFTQMIAPKCWRQAELYALAARLLARNEQIDPFEGFLAGLIQYVGLIVSLRVMDQITGGDVRLGSECFCNILISHARTLSCSITREWQFPAAVVTAIEEQGNKSSLRQLSSTGRVLSTADFLGNLQVLSERHMPVAEAVRGLTDRPRICLAKLAASPSAGAHRRASTIKRKVATAGCGYCTRLHCLACQRRRPSGRQHGGAPHDAQEHFQWHRHNPVKPPHRIMLH